MSVFQVETARAAVMAELRHTVRAIEGWEKETSRDFPVSFGLPAVDRQLPWKGLRRGAVHEVLGDRQAGPVETAGAVTGFTAALARRAAGREGCIFWCQAQPRLYVPGLFQWGIAPEQLLLVWAEKAEARLWALEEALKCAAFAAVVGHVDSLTLKASRRLQLAAEQGGGLGLLLPGKQAMTGATAATSRWRVAPAASREAFVGGPVFQVILDYCRGGRPAEWTLAWDDTTFRFTLVPPLADRRLAAPAMDRRHA